MSASVDEQVVEQETKAMSAEERVFCDAALASLDKDSRVRLSTISLHSNRSS